MAFSTLAARACRLLGASPVERRGMLVDPLALGNRRKPPPVYSGTREERIMSDEKQDFGHDHDHPKTEEEKLEKALEDSMDASDPPSQTRPGDNGDPAPSSGFKED